MISGISSWIMSIAGISILSVVVDLILPNGETSKYIKGVFAFFIIFVIMLPIPNLVAGGFNTDEILSESDVYIQDEYIYTLNRKKLDILEGLVERSIEEVGIDGVKIHISADIFSSNMKIEAVFVDLFNLVIKENLKHIDTNEVIVNSVKKYISIEKEKIIFNG